MFIITQEQYKELIAVLFSAKSDRIDWSSWYKQYCYYETSWNYYFQNIFLPHASVTKNPITFIFWESAPSGNLFPHPNYVFDIINLNKIVDGRSDKYLYETHKCSRLSNSITRVTKQDALIELSSLGYLIIDLFPTHGIQLNSGWRDKMYQPIAKSTSIFRQYSIEKIKACVSQIGLNIESEIFCTPEVYAPIMKITQDDIDELTIVLGKIVSFWKY